MASSGLLAYHRPKRALEAKFSLEFLSRDPFSWNEDLGLTAHRPTRSFAGPRSRT